MVTLGDYLPGSARVSRAGDGVLAVANFFAAVWWITKAPHFRRLETKLVAVEHRNQHAERVRYPEGMKSTFSRLVRL